MNTPNTKVFPDGSELTIIHDAVEHTGGQAGEEAKRMSDEWMKAALGQIQEAPLKPTPKNMNTETKAMIILAAVHGTSAFERGASREPLFDRNLDPVCAAASLEQGQEIFKAWLKAWDMADQGARLLKQALSGFQNGRPMREVSL